MRREHGQAKKAQKYEAANCDGRRGILPSIGHFFMAMFKKVTKDSVFVTKKSFAVKVKIYAGTFSFERKIAVAIF